MQDTLTAMLLIIGSLFMMVGSLGILRMPDLFLRMSASTKASTLGAGTILIATAIHFNDVGVASRAIATLIFLLLTAPVAAHMLARAGYFFGVKLADATVIDELAGRYNMQTHVLNAKSPDDPTELTGDASDPELTENTTEDE